MKRSNSLRDEKGEGEGKGVGEGEGEGEDEPKKSVSQSLTRALRTHYSTRGVGLPLQPLLSLAHRDSQPY